MNTVYESGCDVCEVFDLHAWFEFGLCVLVCCE